MKIFEDEDVVADHEVPLDFGSGDPLDRFARMRVYVPFDSDQRSRRPVEQAVPGYPGRWMCVYSTFDRMAQAHGGDEVEHSILTGAQVLASMPDQAGVWFDRSFPGGRRLMLPPVEVATDPT